MKITKLLAWVVLIQSAQAFAQKAISYNEAVEIAAKDNNQIKAQEHYLESSIALKKAQKATFLPSLSGTLSFDKGHTTLLKGGSETDSKNFNGSLNLRYNLFNGFNDIANYNIANLKIETQEATLSEIKSQISFDLNSALANYFYAKNSLSMSKDIQNRREDNLEMVELRFTSGRENKGSVLLSKAYLEQARLDLLKAENAYRTSTTYIRKVLNLSDDLEFVITDAPPVKAINDNPNFDAIIEKTPTIKKYLASLETSKENVSIAKSNFLPSWDLNASLGKNGEDFFPDDTKKWTVGTSLTWSFFDGGKDFHSTNSAALLKRASERELENQFLDLKKILKDAYTAYQEAQRSVIVSKSFLDAAVIRAEISRSKYNNGLATFDDWDIIENDLITKQRDYIQKNRDQIIAQANWERAQGTGVIP